jgi:hypothetical protein
VMLLFAKWEFKVWNFFITKMMEWLSISRYHYYCKFCIPNTSVRIFFS